MSCVAGWVTGVVDSAQYPDGTYDLLLGGWLKMKLSATRMAMLDDGGLGALLREAAAAGHKDLVSSLLKARVSTSLRSTNARSALHMAAENGEAEVCRLLIAIEQGDGADIPDKQGQTALTLCSSQAVRRVLVPTDSDLDVQEASLPNTDHEASAVAVENVSNVTPLMLACREGRLETAQNLVMEGVDIKQRSKRGCTALSMAAEAGHTDLVGLLLKSQKGDSEEDEKRAAFLAAENGQLASLDVLLAQKSVSPRSRDEHGRTLLMHACRCGHSNIIKALLLKVTKQDLMLVDDQGSTVLLESCFVADVDVLRLIIDKLSDGDSAQPDVCKSRKDGTAAVHIAAEHGRADVLRLLLQADVKTHLIGMKRTGGATALFAACEHGQEQAVHALLAAKADVNVHATEEYTGAGKTPLQCAALSANAAIVRVLLDAKAQPNAARDDGMTSLMLACRAGHESVVVELVRKGADINLRRKDGGSALVLACKNGEVSCVTAPFSISAVARLNACPV
jgi:uncharacterized protein